MTSIKGRGSSTDIHKVESNKTEDVQEKPKGKFGNRAIKAIAKPLKKITEKIGIFKEHKKGKASSDSKVTHSKQKSLGDSFLKIDKKDRKQLLLTLKDKGFRGSDGVRELDYHLLKCQTIEQVKEVISDMPDASIEASNVELREGNFGVKKELNISDNERKKLIQTLKNKGFYKEDAVSRLNDNLKFSDSIESLQDKINDVPDKKYSNNKDAISQDQIDKKLESAVKRIIIKGYSKDESTKLAENAMINSPSFRSFDQYVDNVIKEKK